MAQRSNTKWRPTTGTYRWIAEFACGRAVEAGEVIHHRDHDPHNNDPSNLQIISKSDHARLHPERWMNRQTSLSENERRIVDKYAPKQSNDLMRFKKQHC